MATGGRGGAVVRALVPESFVFCRAPSSAAIASTARVDQRVMCREIRSNLTSPPPPPQLGLTRRATRRTRRLVLSNRRFRSTAGMDSDDMNTCISGALPGRQRDGASFASSAAGRTRRMSTVD